MFALLNVPVPIKNLLASTCIPANVPDSAAATARIEAVESVLGAKFNSEVVIVPATIWSAVMELAAIATAFIDRDFVVNGIIIGEFPFESLGGMTIIANNILSSP